MKSPQLQTKHPFLTRTNFANPVPNRSRNPRLLRNSHPSPNLPTLPHRRRQHDPRLLVQRQTQRTNLAHHPVQTRGSHRLHRRMRHPQHRRPLHQHGHLHHRHLRRQLAHPRLDGQCVRPDQGEESRRYQYRDDGYECQFYLDTVSVAEER